MTTAAGTAFSPEVVIAGGEAAQRNWTIMREHSAAERRCDLDATMATVHRDKPFQIFHATGLKVEGWENVREFYRERFTTFHGQVLFAHRIVVTDTTLAEQGYFRGSPKGIFFGTMTYGKPLFFPITVWVYFKDGLLLGESGYFDGDLVARQIREGADGDQYSEVY